MRKSYTSQEHLESPPSLEIHPQMTTTDNNSRKVLKRLKLLKRSHYPMKRPLNIRTIQSEDKENTEIAKISRQNESESTLTLKVTGTSNYRTTEQDEGHHNPDMGV